MDAREEFLQKLAADGLAWLRFNWDEAYEISYTPPDAWSAKRRDGLGVPLEAKSARELGSAIAADYNNRAVPRPHAAEPIPDTAYTADGPYVNRRVTHERLMRAYPMEAHCAGDGCEQMIRREAPGAPWEHTGRLPGEDRQTQNERATDSR